MLESLRAHLGLEGSADCWGIELQMQNCRQLRIVKKPTTVVAFQTMFRNCKLLNSVSCPGCRQFSHKAFARSNGFVQQKELPIGLATPSLGVSFKGASTWLISPCKSSIPQVGSAAAKVT